MCTPEANLSQTIQWLNVSYGVWWNRRHQQCGSLYQGRFKAVFADRRGDWGRDVTLWAARRLGVYTLRELANEVGGLDYSAIYQAVRRIESRAKKDKELAVRMKSFRDRLKRVYNV